MTNLAHARPVPLRQAAHRPVRAVAPAPRSVGVTRQQRAARPKVGYAVVTVACLFAIFGAQLLLSIAVSDGAYQIQSLQSQQKEALRTQEDLTEQFNLRDSTQYVAASAAKLGMVPAGSRLYLDVQTGAVTSAPGTADPTGCGGSCNLVANSLLTGVPLVDPAAAAAAASATTAAATATTPSAAAPAAPSIVTALPAPVTH